MSTYILSAEAMKVFCADLQNNVKCVTMLKKEGIVTNEVRFEKTSSEC